MPSNVVFIRRVKLKNYKPNNIKKAIIKPNKAIASVNAKPKIANTNIWRTMFGLREIPKIKLPKIIPIPIPEPEIEIVDKPAAINLALNSNIINCLKG